MKEAPTAVVSEPLYFASLPTGFGKSCIMQCVDATTTATCNECRTVNKPERTEGDLSSLLKTLPWAPAEKTRIIEKKNNISAIPLGASGDRINVTLLCFVPKFFHRITQI